MDNHVFRVVSEAAKRFPGQIPRLTRSTGGRCLPA